MASRALGIVAIVLGVLAPLAGNPYQSVRRIDPTQLMAVAARAENQVTPLQLAAWIKDQRPGLHVLDARSAHEFDDDHIPTAERADPGSWSANSFSDATAIVIYSSPDTRDVDAWARLHGLGRPAYLLHGGLNGWLTDVMNPTLASDAAADARTTFADASELSRYFGGQPRRLAPGEPAPSPSKEFHALRHGC